MEITLALGGGGAKGNSHIGVLRRLEKEGFKINAIAGTSFGGIVAVMYAAGYTPDEIEDIFAACLKREPPCWVWRVFGNGWTKSCQGEHLLI
jgi:predicted acylesterase/phospholipase RssA